MKRVGFLMMVLLAFAMLMFAGCGGNEDTTQNQMQEQQQNEQQANDAQSETNPAGANVQKGQKETVALTGEFQGLADGHSAEILVDGESIVFQFYDEGIAEQMELMETNTIIQFEIETDSETGAKTIVKLYEITE